MECGANDVELSVIGFVALNNAEARVFHIPHRPEHPYSEIEPVEVLRGGDIDAVDIACSLKMGGEGSAHRAKNNRRDFAAFFGYPVNMRP